MKKRFLLTLMCIATLSCTLTGCNDYNPKSNKNTASGVSGFEPIPEHPNLFYETEYGTDMIYYIFSSSVAIGRQGYGYGYMAPYYSENGKLCRYIDGEIVEINNTVEVTTEDTAED